MVGSYQTDQLQGLSALPYIIIQAKQVGGWESNLLQLLNLIVNLKKKNPVHTSCKLSTQCTCNTIILYSTILLMHEYNSALKKGHYRGTGSTTWHSIIIIQGKEFNFSLWPCGSSTFFKEQGTESCLVGPAVQICISPLRELQQANEREGWRGDCGGLRL